MAELKLMEAGAMDFLGSFFATGPVAVCLLACLLLAPLGRWQVFIKESGGMLVLILFTFTPGQWFFRDTRWQAWMAHGVGCLVADWVPRGPDVCPSMSLANLAMGKVTYPEFLCRVGGQMMGALVGFPLCEALAAAAGLPPLSGPKLDPAGLGRAVTHEFWATFCLAWAIYLCNFVLPIRKIYLVKQAVCAMFIRGILLSFPAAGPAMNPALGTAFAVLRSSRGAMDAVASSNISSAAVAPSAVLRSDASWAVPDTSEHFLCYWAASIAGALVATALYAAFSGEPFCGVRLRGGRPMDQNGQRKKQE